MSGIKDKAARDARKRASSAFETARGEGPTPSRAASDEEPRLIGRLSEGALHAYLKKYIEPDESCHERQIFGYWADIARDGEIVEIQTNDFGRLRAKLVAFLNEYHVTVVYPTASVKYLSWIDPDTGETSSPRRSPKKGSARDILPEIYRLGELALHPKLSFRAILLELTEYKSLCGWSRDRKRGAWRVERIPGAVTEDITLSRPSDFRALLPESLPERFTSAEFGSACRFSGRRRSYALAALVRLGVIEQVGKRGRAFLYSIKK